jgi:hypothetical protein
MFSHAPNDKVPLSSSARYRGMVAVRFVVLRLQYRPHVPRLNTDHRQAHFGESAKSHCDSGPASNPIRLKWQAKFVSTPWTNGQVERMNRTLKDATVQRYHYVSHRQITDT